MACPRKHRTCEAALRLRVWVPPFRSRSARTLDEEMEFLERAVEDHHEITGDGALGLAGHNQEQELKRRDRQCQPSWRARPGRLATTVATRDARR